MFVKWFLLAIDPSPSDGSDNTLLPIDRCLPGLLLEDTNPHLIRLSVIFFEPFVQIVGGLELVALHGVECISASLVGEDHLGSKAPLTALP